MLSGGIEKGELHEMGEGKLNRAVSPNRFMVTETHLISIRTKVYNISNKIF